MKKVFATTAVERSKTGTNDSVVATQNETQGKPIQKLSNY